MTTSPGSTLSDQAWTGTALVASHGEGPRKGGLIKTCLHMSQLAHRGQQASSKCGRNTSNEKRRIPLALKGGNRLKLAWWNIRIMLDSCNSTWPERRSALIEHELARLNIDIAALSEICFSEEACLRERGAGYRLYWSGKSIQEKRLSCVRFMVMGLHGYQAYKPANRSLRPHHLHASAT